MHLFMNIPAEDSLDALLDIEPSAIERLVLVTTDGDELAFEQIEDIARLVDRETRRVGLGIVATAEDTVVDAQVVVPIVNIESVTIELKSSTEYDLGHECTCKHDDSHRGSRVTGLSVELPTDLNDLIDPVAQVVANLKPHLPEHIVEAMKANARRVADALRAQQEEPEQDSSTEADEAPDADENTEKTDTELPIEGLEDLPEEVRSFVEDLVAGLDVEGLAGVRVVKVPGAFGSSGNTDSGASEENDDAKKDENTDDFGAFAQTMLGKLNALRENIEKVSATADVLDEKLTTDIEKPRDDAASTSSKNDQSTEESAEGSDTTTDKTAVEAELAEKAEKLKAAFGGVVTSKDNETPKVEKVEETKKPIEKTAKKSDKTDAPTKKIEPKKLVDVRRGKDDRLYTGPNFTSTKNRLGEGRVKKIVEILEAAKDGQKVEVGYRNTGRAGIVRGVGRIEHDFHDRGRGHTAKVGVTTSSFGASIVGPDGSIDEDLMELTLFEA